MSPLLFLSIPLVVFIIGSSALWFVNRWRTGTTTLTVRRAPDDLQALAPMLQEQRRAHWRTDLGDRTVRS